MDRAKKKKIKRIIALCCAVLVVALLAAMPLFVNTETPQDGPQASILSGTAENGSIESEIVGGGAISEETAVEIKIPTGVKLAEYLVSNGDTVKAGDAIAVVDRVTVMNAISEVQETLEYLSEQIEEASEEDVEAEIEATAGGTVKLIYAQEGDIVQEVILTHGALAVLSLDGLMAVEINAVSDVAVGSEVTVVLTDETTVMGTVESNLNGKIVITVADDDYTVGANVTVLDGDGNTVGSGELYIYNPWNVTGYSGVVSDIEISENDSVDAGDTLFELENVGFSAEYTQLVEQRKEYEELMIELFTMYQTEVITAPCDGVVSGVDENSVQLLAKDGSYVISLLANSPDGNDEVMYSNYVGKITGIGSNGWSISVNPMNIEIADYTDLSLVPLDEMLMTEVLLHTQLTVPVYELSEGVWVQADPATVSAGDIVLLAADNTGNIVWIVRIQKSAANGEAAADPNNPTIPNGGSSGMQPSVSYPSYGGSFGGYQDGSTVTEEEEYELFDMEKTVVASVTPQEKLTLQITVDELDVVHLEIGMDAEIKATAVSGEHYYGTISDISNTGTNNGGNSKFVVTISFDRNDALLAGMTATASITINTVSSATVVPAAALTEQGTETVVYTGYDEESGELVSPVTVTTGASDGENVEILSGLESGDTYYYAYYDTLEISFTPDFGGTSFFGMN